MKKLKQIFADVQATPYPTKFELNTLLWQLICYSPKMPLRLQQQQLLDEAEKFSLQINDQHFAHAELTFKGFEWGNGKHKILLTHGWASKAADWVELITALKEIPGLQIIAFDAPGNGSSEGELSNLLLYVEAVKAVILHCGEPEIIIGHSLGATANILALQLLAFSPAQLISLTPLIRLRENFEATMNSARVPQGAQEEFFNSFEKLFGKPAAYYNLAELYNLDGRHWLAYDEQDAISLYVYMEEFLTINPAIECKSYNGVGHERILKSTEMVEDVVGLVTMIIQ